METFTDYPESASNNARKALKWRDETGNPKKCGTPVGWARANQLAKREPISEDTVRRMASFNRHKQHADVPYEEGCGGLMWDAWGGTTGVNWAIAKSASIDNALIDKYNNMQEIELIGDVSGYWDDVNLNMLKYNLPENGEDVLITMNSGGGDVLEGFAIRNQLAGYEGETTVRVLALAASIASVILTGADKVYLENGAFVMIHNVSIDPMEAVTSKKLKSLGRTAEKMDKEIINAYLDAIEKRGKLIDGDRDKTRTKLVKDMNAETWYTAQEAIDLGLADGYWKRKKETKDEATTASVSGLFLNKAYRNVPKQLLTNDNTDTMDKTTFVDYLKSFFNSTEGKTAVRNASMTDAQIEAERLANELENAKKLLSDNGYTYSEACEVEAETVADEVQETVAETTEDVQAETFTKEQLEERIAEAVNNAKAEVKANVPTTPKNQDQNQKREARDGFDAFFTFIKNR